MALNIYCGLMGSGKTYEVVSSVILPALKTGRRIVTNIEGLRMDAIRDFIRAGGHEGEIGTVVQVTNEDVLNPGFWAVDDTDSATVKGGDMVCLDEAWRFFGSDPKPGKEMMVFLREHRHFTDKETGVTCDLVLMLQSPSDLHRSVRSVVELSFLAVKLKTVGANHRYRLDMFEGADQRTSRRVNSFQKKYEKEIYDLYHSYAVGAGTEVAIDKRQNVLKDPKFWGFLVGAVVLSVVAWWGLSYLYGKYAKGGDKATATATAAAPGQKPGQPAPPPEPPKPDMPEDSDTWRYAGVVIGHRGAYDVATSGSGLRLVRPEFGSDEGASRFVLVDNKRITSFTGPVDGTRPSSSSILGVK